MTMMTKDKAIELIQASLDSLHEGGMLPERLTATPDTVLLGVGATLDSLGFVTFVSDLEDRLTRELGTSVFFALDDIQDFNINNPFLSASVFVNYMMRLSGDA